MIISIFNMICNVFLFPGLVHSAGWLRLRQESCVLRQKGLANGTWFNRSAHLRAYIAFTCYFGVPDFPVHLKVLLRFTALLARGPYAFGSAVNILGGLRWFAKILDPASEKHFDSVLFKISMKGLKAQLSRPLRQKLPLSVDHLAKFYASLGLSAPKHLAV